MTDAKQRAWSRLPLLSIGLRPFYILGAGFGSGAILRWTLESTDRLERVQTPSGHAHDMVFGFVGAFIAGFLLTAVANWTNRPTLTGSGLAVLALVWLAARVAGLAAGGALAAALDLIFWLTLLAAVARPIVAARAWRNLPVCGIVLLLGALDLMSHLAAAGRWGAVDAAAPVAAAVSVTAVLATLIAGRVIPTFLDRAVGAPLAIRRPWTEHGALASTASLAVLDVASLGRSIPPGLIALVAGLATLFHLARLVGWRPLRSRNQPLLWSLALAYAWLPAAFALRASAALGVSSASAATHAMTIGVLCGLIAAIATRSSRGHTGRPLRADRADVFLYGLVAAAAGLRVAAEVWAPGRSGLLLTAGLALSAGFALFLIRYAAPLITPRVDEIEG